MRQSKPSYLSDLLMVTSANNRHGVTFSPQLAMLSKSDVPRLFHVGVAATRQAGSWQSASGGVASDRQNALLAGIGEGIERYAAAQAIIPEQSRQDLPADRVIGAEMFALFSAEQQEKPGFPFGALYDSSCLYTEVFSLATHEPVWVPQPLVVLRDDYATGIPTSSGLAAGRTPADALLRGLEEIIERDALMATWMHSLPGKRIGAPQHFEKEVTALHGNMYVFDITPAYSPFPVIAVAGMIPKRGKPRFSLGVACRESLELAIEKAYMEWCQGVYFTGIYSDLADTSHLQSPTDVRNFDDHAIFYTLFPDAWNSLPLFAQHTIITTPRTTGTSRRGKAALTWAIHQLERAGIRTYYRDLTTVDALQAGVYVVRVLSPDMTPINAHHEWPFLGGNAADVRQRFPDATSGPFPNPWPHPLG